MEPLHSIIRWLHLIAASAWFGEVVLINFVLIPLMGQVETNNRNELLQKLFPKIFRLASVLSALTVITGVVLLGFRLDWQFQNILETSWGVKILIGGSLGILLTLFHFFMEEKLGKRIGLSSDNPELADDIHLKLKIVPRMGLLVITSIMTIMTLAAHA